MKTKFTLISFLSLGLMYLITLPIQAQPFMNPMPVPYLMPGPHFDIDITSSQHNFDPNGSVTSDGSPLPVNISVALDSYCYNEIGNTGLTYNGPVLIFTKDEFHTFNISNFVADQATTTVHWHGLNLPAEDDGGPHQTIPYGTTWSPSFPMIDPVQTIWYHSHLMDFTTDQVIRGMAGMIIVEDPQNDPYYDLLPRDYGVNDIPINIQEKSFEFDTINNVKVAKAIVAGEKPGPGKYTLVNGVVNAVRHVPAGVVRLRILNGSHIKMFHIGLSKTLKNPTEFETMNMFATGGGYLDTPRPTKSTVMSVGDRREFLVDFSQYADGDTIYMSNLNGNLPFDAKYGSTPGDAFMAFIVDNSIVPSNPITTIPSTLLPYSLAPGPVFKTRHKQLFGAGENGGGVGQTWTIDGTPMDLAVINDTVLVNTKEKWVIENLTNKAHPFHIHKVQFQVVEYEGVLGFPNENGKIIDSSGVWAYPDLPDELIGYKDVQLIRTGAILTFEARFDSFPSPYDMPNLNTHGFMYHCHILTHEDNSMMHQFVVVDSLLTNVKIVENDKTLKLFPNPATNSINFEGTYTDGGQLRFYDVAGRMLEERDVLTLPGASILTGNLPRGIIFVEFVSGKNRYVEKLILE